MKKIWIVPVAAALAAGGWYYWQQHHQSGLPEGFAQSNGRLELKRFDVASLYAGRVKAMLVDEGSRVEEGDVLAELSSDTSVTRVSPWRSQAAMPSMLSITWAGAVASSRSSGSTIAPRAMAEDLKRRTAMPGSVVDVKRRSSVSTLPSAITARSVTR